jgi:HIRAN domain
MFHPAVPPGRTRHWAHREPRRTASLPSDPADAGLSPRPSDPSLSCSTGMKLDACWYSDEEWRGYVPLVRRRDLLDHHAFVTWVAGITHHSDAADLPDFAPGSEVVLRPELDNPFDESAVGVWNATGTVQVGYLPAVIVHDLPRLSEDRHGLMVGEMVQGTDRIGLWVVVAREPVVLRVVSKVGEPPTRSVEAWVRHAKDALHHAEEWKALRSVDPLERMRRMAADLKQSA